MTYLTNPITQTNYTNTFGSGNLSNLPNCFFSGFGGGLTGFTAIYFDQLGTPWTCTNTGTPRDAGLHRNHRPPKRHQTNHHLHPTGHR